jgi:hypothetical protein
MRPDRTDTKSIPPVTRYDKEIVVFDPLTRS